MDIWSGWENDYDRAMDRAMHERKPVLLQFEREDCQGCARLYTTTYQDSQVREELHRWFVPLKLNIRTARAIRSQLSAVWTPSFYFLDSRGRSFHSVPGYLPPVEFRLTLRLGLAKILIPKGKYEEALTVLENGLQLFPSSPLGASLLYWKIIAHYLKTWDKAAMRQNFEQMRQQYPHSIEAQMWPYPD